MIRSLLLLSLFLLLYGCEKTQAVENYDNNANTQSSESAGGLELLSRSIDDYDIYVGQRGNTIEDGAILLHEEDKEKVWGVIQKVEDSDLINLEEKQSIGGLNNWIFMICDKETQNLYYIENNIFYEDEVSDGGPTVLCIYQKNASEETIYQNVEDESDKLNDIAQSYHIN